MASRAKGLTRGSGRTQAKRYLEPLTKLIQERQVDTTSLISHRSEDLADVPDLYQTFKTKRDGCVKAVFHPGARCGSRDLTKARPAERLFLTAQAKALERFDEVLRLLGQQRLIA
jgi:hypothetical protein